MDDAFSLSDDFDFFDSNDAFGDFGIANILEENFIESAENVSARSIRLDARRSMLRVKQKDNLRSVIGTPPKRGEQIRDLNNT